MIEKTSLACVLAVLAAAGPVETTPEPLDATPISLGLSLQPLIDHFNAGQGNARFVALVSSTCPACVFGAESVKASVLDAYPDADIQVSVVWIDMLPSDNRGAALKSSALFGDPPDPRLKQFHDPNQRTGRAFASTAPSWRSAGWTAGFASRGSALRSRLLPASRRLMSRWRRAWPGSALKEAPAWIGRR